MAWPEPQDLLEGYLTAKHEIILLGFERDITWAEGLAHVNPTPQYVFEETAWVIVNSGFKFTVATKLWPRLRQAFNGMALDLVTLACRAAALAVLNHQRKVDAIIALAELIRREGIATIVADAHDPPRLARLPHIGPVTCWHVAKLLGADVVKPDVHLVRAGAAVLMSPQALCAQLAGMTGDRVTTADSVLWRWGEQTMAGLEEWRSLFGYRTDFPLPK